MKFKASDTCIEDYHRRRDAYIGWLTATEPPSKARARKMLEWMKANSPYEPHEQMQNLRRAIYGDERH